MAADASELNLSVAPLYPVDNYEDVFVDLYKRITKRDIARLCWRTDMPPQTLRAFLNFMDNRKAVFIVFDNHECAGLFWIEDIISGVQCEFSGWIPFAYRGLDSELIMRYSLDFVHEKIHIPCIRCQTPWPSGRSICLRAGMTLEHVLSPYSTGAKMGKLWIFKDLR